MLIFAVVFINLALVFYTIGVWSEKIQKNLKVWHVIMFWLGLTFDIMGTSAMSIIAGSQFNFDFHGITGMLAIILMIIHTLWATIVLIKKDDKVRKTFHKFSFIVWLIWLLPMISGMIFGMTS